MSEFVTGSAMSPMFGNDLASWGDSGDSSSGNIGNSGNIYGFDSSMYDSGGFDSYYNSMGPGTLSPDTGLADSGYFDYGSANNPFSYDANTGDYMGTSMYSAGDFGMGGYTPTSADSGGRYSNTAYGGNPPEGNEFLRRYKDLVSPLQPLLKNPIISTLMSLNPTTALLKTVLGGPTSVGSFLGSLFGRGLGPVGSLAGAVGGGQLANYATTGEFAPMTPANIGGLAGAGAGLISGNPYGPSIGSFLGSQLGGMSTPGGGTGNISLGSPGVNPGWSLEQNLLPTGMNNGFGGAIANAGLSLNTNRSLGNQIKTLEGLFGQDSSYAKAMRQQLERRDAAGGRRSQYGPREVELQAMLAQQAAKLQPGLQQLYSQKNANTNLLVQSLLRNPDLTKGIKEGWDGLKNIFQTPNVSTEPLIAFDDPFVGGGFQSGNAGMGD